MIMKNLFLIFLIPFLFSNCNNIPNNTPTENTTLTESLDVTTENTENTENNSPSLTPKMSSNLTIEQYNILKQLIESMVYIKGGTFSMGVTSRSYSKNDDTSADVTLNDFYIGKYEITEKQWQCVMGGRPMVFDPNTPACHISWDDCQTFIKNIRELTGINFDLPTEAQWEYAARGGNMSKNYIYSGSNNPDNVAWYRDNSRIEGGLIRKQRKVGLKLPNELGLYDMSGNVAEWCNYCCDTLKNVTETDHENLHIHRGGSYNDNSDNVQVTKRDSERSNFIQSDVGLRLVISIF